MRVDDRTIFLYWSCTDKLPIDWEGISLEDRRRKRDGCAISDGLNFGKSICPENSSHLWWLPRFMISVVRSMPCCIRSPNRPIGLLHRVDSVYHKSMHYIKASSKYKRHSCIIINT